MIGRLTEEREAEIRERRKFKPGVDLGVYIDELLAEVEALRVERGTLIDDWARRLAKDSVAVGEAEYGREYTDMKAERRGWTACRDAAVALLREWSRRWGTVVELRAELEGLVPSEAAASLPGPPPHETQEPGTLADHSSEDAALGNLGGVDAVASGGTSLVCTYCGLSVDDAAGGACSTLAGPEHDWQPCTCPKPGPFKGSDCIAAKHGLPRASDDWCFCGCHKATDEGVPAGRTQGGP